MVADDPLSIPSPESNTTGSTSMSTLDLDEAAIVTEDPQYIEHLHSYQSQVYVEDDSPLIHVPPFSPYHQLTFNGPHTPPYSYDNPAKTLNLFKPRSSSRSSTKQKNLKYKSMCQTRFSKRKKGHKWTDDSSSVTSKTLQILLDGERMSQRKFMYFVSLKNIIIIITNCVHFMSSLPSIHDDELRHQIPSPVKESNLKEENCRKNYFPVPWRVIGGGVRVGITEKEDSNLYSTANTSRPVNHPASKLEKNDTPTKTLASRKRSNSNPPTPSPHSLQFKVEHVCPPFHVILFEHSN